MKRTSIMPAPLVETKLLFSAARRTGGDFKVPIRNRVGVAGKNHRKDGLIEKIEKPACNSEQMADYVNDATGNSSRNSCTLVCSESKPRARRGVSFLVMG
jgi:hypothetical protein